MRLEEFKNILDNIERGIYPSVFERDKLWEIYEFLKSLPNVEASRVSENEQAKESNDLEDNADFYYCRACLAIHEEECCCELDG